MKYFIYTYSEKIPRTGACQKTVSIHRIIKNRPAFIAAMTDSYVSEFQLVLQCMEKAKVLPRAAFKRNQFGGYRFCNASAMRDSQFATITRI